MKVSSNHEVNLPIEVGEVELLQQGGRMKLLNKDKLKKQTAATPSKPESTKTLIPLKATPGPIDYSRNQGTITVYDKSPREKLMSAMHKLSNVGNGALTNLVSEPILSGARLLRPDKYFEGVDSDSKFGSALGDMLMDAAIIAPVIPLTSNAGKGIKQLARKSTPNLKLNLSAPIEVPNKGNLISDTHSEIRDGIDWMNEWKSNVNIRGRMLKNKMDGGYTRKDPLKIGYASDESIDRVNSQVGGEAFSKSSGGFYVGTGDPYGLGGKAFITKEGLRTAPKSITVHELTHQLSDGNQGLSKANLQLLQEPFSGQGMVRAMKQKNPKHAKSIDYFTDPTEVHARINQLRMDERLKATDVVSVERAAEIAAKVKAGAYPAVNKSFGVLINNPQGLANVFNKMFTPAIAGGLYMANGESK